MRALCRGAAAGILGSMTKTLLSIGHGYCAQALAAVLMPQGWRVIGTSRDQAGAQAVRATGAEAVIWAEGSDLPGLDQATHVLTSVAPDAAGDPVLRGLQARIAGAAPHLDWVGYLSTTAVYGDHGGAWVDEATPLTPASQRGQWRVRAEGEWAAIPDLALHIFRLAGIYGPGRGPFAKVRAGTARRIIKPGQVFSRIHVADVVQVLAASMARPNPGAVYNLCDDDPAPPEEVIAHAAGLLGLPVPPAVAFETADLTPMARSFYGENKRVRNDRFKEELGVELRYPGYHEGLGTLLLLENTLSQINS